MTPEERAARKKAIKEHWDKHAVTGSVIKAEDGPPVDKQVKRPTVKK